MELTITKVDGGFILEVYDSPTASGKYVFTSQSKLLSRVKELLSSPELLIED